MDAGFETNFGDFNRNMARYCDELGMAGPEVVRKQAGLLARTLIELSGPKSVSKAKEKIGAGVQRAFGSDSRDSGIETGGKHGSGDVHWYSWDEKNLRGIARDVDVRDKTSDDLYDLYNKLRGMQTSRGMLIAGKRGKQTIKIWQKYVAKKSQLAKLIRRLQGHIGRRQAGWLPAWRITGSPQGSAGPVGQKVLDHENGARGFYLDGLGIPNGPTFELVNTAVGSSKLNAIVSSALRIRAKAMADDLRLYIRGIKKVGAVS